MAMQLVLKLDDRARTLEDIHRRLQRYVGPCGPFVRLDPVSQLVMGLIGGRTRGEVSKAAFEALLTRFGRWESVRDAPVAEVEEVIGSVTFADVKAPRLKATLAAITRCHGRLSLDSLENRTVDEALAWLERLPGVGRKVAAATLNFSTLRKAALVIDTHHLRVLRRLGLVSRRSDVRRAYESIMPLLPPEWSSDDLDEHHQLMKTLGQTICRHGGPICFRCSLQEYCPTATSQSLGSEWQSIGRQEPAPRVGDDRRGRVIHCRT